MCPCRRNIFPKSSRLARTRSPKDIANALNSLGGTGSGSSVSIGGSSSGTSTGSTTARPGGTAGSTGGNGFNTQQRTGTTGTTGVGGGGAYGGGGGFGTTANGTPGGGQTFQQRLQSIIQRAAGGGQQDQIQIFGQTKIIADQRSNSLLIFATRDDMERIKAVVAKLDVLLSQVLIESVIMEVSLGKTLSTGVSAVQNPSAINTPNFKGAGSIFNGPKHSSEFLVTNQYGELPRRSSDASSFGTALTSGGIQIFWSDWVIPTTILPVQAAASTE